MVKGLCTLPPTAVLLDHYHETTITVCKQICSEHLAADCSGFLYDRVTRTCAVTSFTGEHIRHVNDSEIVCEQQKKYFFKKMRCPGKYACIYIYTTYLGPAMFFT